MTTDKVALITGGTSGIGRATALAFSKRGDIVVLTGRRAKEGEEIVAQIRDNGGQGLFLQGDISQARTVEKMIAETVNHFRRLDYAFNNAGVDGSYVPLHEETEENYDYVMDINVRGVWLAMKHEIAYMRKNGGGVIVNNSSVAGLCGFPNCGTYAASKFAVIGLTKVGALENATMGIRVNAICPGGVRSEMVDRLTGKDPKIEAAFGATSPMRRIGESEEAADVVLWLCSDRSTFVNGQEIAIDGGKSASFAADFSFKG